MAIPFSQSVRSLQSERGIPSLVVLGIGISLLVLWAGWFFLAPITRYQTGTLMGWTRDGRVVAEFPAQAYEQIWQGQPAYIRPQARVIYDTSQDAALPAGEPAGAIPAVVANILGPATDGHFQVTFSILGNPPSAAILAQGSLEQDDLNKSLSGEVDVEVESVSPATLVARASGQFTDAPSVTFSPQGNQ